MADLQLHPRSAGGGGQHAAVVVHEVVPPGCAAQEANDMMKFKKLNIHDNPKCEFATCIKVAHKHHHENSLLI